MRIYPTLLALGLLQLSGLGAPALAIDSIEPLPRTATSPAKSGAADGTAQSLYVQSLAATCANCHGTEGRAVNGSAVPGIAGLPRDYIAAQMLAFKNGQRQATVMHQLAKGYSDAQIQQIATYFAAQKK
jgi:cytochrome c553